MTLSLSLLTLPFLIQALAISLDEFYFHWRRGLPRWELISHPIDTLCLLACLLFALTQPYGVFNLKVYIGLCLLSCLLVTKDEAVHRRECTPHECWLHSVLFLTHPVVLIDTALLWRQQLGREVLWLFALAVSLFLIYQIIFAWIKTQRIPHESTEE